MMMLDFIPTFGFLRAYFVKSERLPRHACPCILFAVIGPVVDFTDVFLPGFTFLPVVRAVFHDRFDLVFL
ncbi:hypothetical protein D3C85_1678250 [compost metagenome]